MYTETILNLSLFWLPFAGTIQILLHPWKKRMK